MAGDWIKMRGALLDHPKVIAMTRELLEVREFRDWLTPGGGGVMNGQIVSDPASRAVTTSCLLRAWSSAREHGKFDGEDLWLPHSEVDDIDQIAGAPGVGAAMEAVGWLKPHPSGKGVILPNFKEFNVPMTEAERAKSYRERRKRGVTEPSRTHRDENTSFVTTRVEKSIKPPIVPRGVVLPVGFSRFWAVWPPSPRKVARAKCLKVWVASGCEPKADEIVFHVELMAASKQWRDGFEPAPLTYLGQRRWEDGAPAGPAAERRLAT